MQTENIAAGVALAAFALVMALAQESSHEPPFRSVPCNMNCCDLSDPMYQRTRKFVLSQDNPYFFSGKAAEGIGGPHIGLRQIWPLSMIWRALTSTDDVEIATCLKWLRDTTAGTGFMDESFDQDNAGSFTRPWLAWANSLFGELIVKLAVSRPSLPRQSL